MNTPDSTTAPSARLRSVQQLLEKLGSMKNRGLGARERLEFMQRQGPELIEDFTFEDAFDADARASSARVTQLGELDSSVQQLETAWRGAPIRDDVRAAGSNLIGHISGFVQQAQKLERVSEIDMLSQLWDQAPDVSSTWPELSGVSRRTSSKRTVRQELEASDSELEKVKSDLEGELTGENLEATELPTEADQVRELRKLWPEVKELSRDDLALEKNRELATRIRNEPELRARLAGAPLEETDGRVVGKVSRESGSSELEGMPKLKEQAWTEAIQEATLRPWQPEMWANSGRGILMRWVIHHDEAAYIRLETSRSTSPKHRVRLEWTDPKIRIGSFEVELSSTELEELHLDPSSFVTEALGPR